MGLDTEGQYGIVQLKIPCKNYYNKLYVNPPHLKI